MQEPVARRLAGKVAIVTGAGRGIGAAIAKLFAQQGAQVVVNARTPEHVDGIVAGIVADEGVATGISADIGTGEGVDAVVKAAIDEFEAIDIMVHNAGIFPYDPIESMTDAAWQRVIDVNLTSGFRLTRRCIPHLKASKGGRILFTSSVQGNRVAVPGCAHYAASKGGLNGLIRAAALELAPHGITVNGVEPGLVATEGVQDAISGNRRQRMAEYVPLKRWGQPEETAQAMLYLASDDAAYVTGQTIVVDGGALLPQNGTFMV